MIEPNLVPQVSYIKTTFDSSATKLTSNLLLLQNNRLYMVANNPNKMQLDYLYIDYNPTNHLIKSAYKDTLTSSGAVFYGIPTIVNTIG